VERAVSVRGPPRACQALGRVPGDQESRQGVRECHAAPRASLARLASQRDRRVRRGDEAAAGLEAVRAVGEEQPAEAGERGSGHEAGDFRV